MAKHYNPNTELIQGESGTQSKSGGHGALCDGAWTEEKQAKQLVRHTLADLMTDVHFTSYFSCMDMIEALNGNVDDKSSYLDYGYFGILGADFEEDGKSIGEYYKKPSYYVLQNICLIFCLKMLTLAIICIILNTVNKSCIAGFERFRQFGMK